MALDKSKPGIYTRIMIDSLCIFPVNPKSTPMMCSMVMPERAESQAATPCWTSS
jgi:hypothetical protein